MFYLPPESLVLVAVVPTRRDLEIARLLGWYRIPLRRAPKVISVDCMAFYQTGDFGPEHRWRIESYALVKGNELVTRSELFRDDLNHPRAREEYYKLSLGPLENLPCSIKAEKWKRITFFYTTGQLLIKAKTINDLVVRSEEREVFWRSLRERGLQSGLYQSHELPEIALDPSLLAMLGAFFR